MTSKFSDNPKYPPQKSLHWKNFFQRYAVSSSHRLVWFTKLPTFLGVGNFMSSLHFPTADLARGLRTSALLSTRVAQIFAGGSRLSGQNCQGVPLFWVLWLLSHLFLASLLKISLGALCYTPLCASLYNCKPSNNLQNQILRINSKWHNCQLEPLMYLQLIFVLICSNEE